ncbi:MAG TPA: glycosyltransferase 87 family protein [Solirubrobacteraceae bacterium]|nr:glycosyltransferase 87 family protein [Solirubrobacteraceae bacterium]
MSRRLRDHGPALGFAAVAAWAAGYVSLFGFGWNDYDTEALPAYTALTGGHVWQFLKLAPAYGGSLELRAPFALLPGLWHGSPDAVYQATSGACLVAAVMLAVWLVARMRAIGQTRLAWATTLVLCTFNPVTLYALQYGHAEELLGAVLCIGAVVSAQRGRAGWAGLLLGLAIVNKEWALLAIGPVLLALGAGRVRALLIAGAVSVVFYVPLLLPILAAHGSLGGFGPVSAARAGQIFQPWQLWWFLGSHGHVIRDQWGIVKVGYRSPPGGLLSSIVHPLIIGLSVPATLLAARRGRRDALLLLTFLLALRCALDTWNVVYYELPFLLALLAWESLSCRRPPVLSLAASVAVWLLLVEAPGRLTPDQMALIFAALALPSLLALGLAVYGRGLTIPAVLRRDFGRRSSAPAAAPISTV